ncbi:MAG: phospho-sugar mutase [Clostridiaceae bacterium]|nr:phospho-sugar mutase [Clostridiaceae bacterium]
MEQYQIWLNNPAFDEETRRELLSIRDDATEIEDRFYQNLSFGTAGLRGILGAGTNRMNRYTVARAAEGFAGYMKNKGDETCRKGIVICYDPRRYSKEFATITALIFAGHGIRVRLSDELRPVPLLSFAIRYFGAAGGVMLTASHNPAQYNGFKAYGEDGAQLPPEDADLVAARMDTITDLAAVTWPDEETALAGGLLSYFGPDVDQAYDRMLLGLSLGGDAVRRQKDMKIVYTPLHGTGNKPVRRILKKIGFTNVLVVPEQEQPDPDFSTVDYPNPEERSALSMGIRLAEQEGADLVIATDPDADRTGLCVRTKSGEYQVLSGNQIGVLLLDFILEAHTAAGSMPDKPFAVTTVVSTRLTRRIAQTYEIKLFECLTGFKFIAELVKEHDEEGDMHFLFGFEESYGYLAGRDVRDKDAVVASMLIAEMAAVAKDQGLTLADRLLELYRRYGYMAEKTVSITREGKAGQELIKAAMTSLRENKAKGLAGVPVRVVDDYLTSRRLDLQTGKVSPLNLPRSDVLIYELDGLDWFGVRPSGTEPKIKIYFGVHGDNQADCDRRLDDLIQRVKSHVTGEL